MSKTAVAYQIKNIDTEDSVDDPNLINLDDLKRSKLLKLQRRLNRLREELSGAMLQHIKQYKNSFEDANKVAGELNASLKTKY